jgi:CRISPR system Cascade subunit CasA
MLAGRPVLLSLSQALARAHEIDGLAIGDPLQHVAVLRQLLLPVVLHAFGVPRNEQEWAARWDLGRFDPSVVTEYFANRAGRFDLFDPQRPFAQVAGLRTEQGATKPVSLLLPAIATGNNVPLFSSRIDNDPPHLSPAEALGALLAAHCWETAAIKSGAVGDPQAKNGKTTGNPTGPLGQLGIVVPIGATLAETLTLNTPIVRQGLRPDDRPQWDTDEATAQWRTREAAGLLDLLTWQSRRIRLIPEQTPNGFIVRTVVVAAGDRLGHIPDFEPHTAWRSDRKPTAKSGPRKPIRHQPGRAPWRGLASLLATTNPTDGGESSSLLMTQLSTLRAMELVPPDLRLQVLTVGVAYGNQSAVVEDALSDLIPLPITALPEDNPVRDLLMRAVKQAEDLRIATNRLGDELRRAAGADNNLPWDKGMRLGEALVHELDGAARRLLAGLQREPHRVKEAENAWTHTAHRLAWKIAEPALDSVSPAAFLGREIEVRKQRHLYRPALAEKTFRASLNKILGTPN